MNDAAPRQIPLIEPSFYENQQRFPAEELQKYFGQRVAWSLDGKKILAAGTTDEEVEKRLAELGIDPSQVVGDYIDEPGVAYFGGFEAE